eukprot:m.8758 g.8758  ORF g.8758 m.8758 type:complete len:1203 (-) comp2563_c0_seq1:23-3631(-)
MDADHVPAEAVAIPPSPNWFCSSVASMSGLNLVYAAGSKVVLLEGRKLVAIGTAPKRVTSVGYLHAQQHHVAVGLDDGSVGTFDLSGTTPKAGHSFKKGHSVHSAAVSALACTRAASRVHLEAPIESQVPNVDVVVCTDKKGGVSRWLLPSGGTSFIQPAKVEAVSVAALDVVAAVGYRDGAVAVLSFAEASPVVQHWLREHSLEVQCVSFVPLMDHILCSSGRDGFLRLWNIHSGHQQCSFALPPPTKRNGKARDGTREKLWLAHLFLLPKTSLSSESSDGTQLMLLSTTYQGDLLLWSISTSTWDMSQAPQPLTGSQRARAVFQMCADVDDPSNMVAISSDREITCWNIPDLHREWDLSTIGGHVYAMCNSGIDPEAIALGCGDNTIRVWNLGGADSCMTLWQGITARVTAIRWHPSQEGVLAFGMENGRSAVYDVPKDKCVIVDEGSLSSVFAICWGYPHELHRQKNEHRLLVGSGSGSLKLCAGGPGSGSSDDVFALLGVDTKTHKANAVDWSVREPHYLAVGLVTGGVLVADKDMRLLTTILGHDKSVTSVAWSSSIQPLLATGSKDGTVCIHDVWRLAPVDSTSLDDVEDRTRRFTQGGHIVSLSWSPHEFELLLAASTSGTAQIWATRSGTRRATLTGHIKQILCCAWSASRFDTVVTGGVDHSARAWIWVDHPPVHDKEERQPQHKPNSNGEKAPSKDSSLTTASGTDGGHRREKKGRSVLPGQRTWKQESLSQRQEACIALARKSSPSSHPAVAESTDEALSSMSLFMGRQHTQRAVQEERNSHSAHGRHTSAMVLDVWQGTLLEGLQQACEEKRLTENMVAMSAHLGTDVWTKVIGFYAEQLALIGDTHNAATYYVLRGDIEMAIETYVHARQFTEAVALAHLRLPKSSPTIPALYNSWAAYSEDQQDFEQAAKCFIALKQYDKAVDVVGRRGGRDGIFTAVRLAREVGVTPADMIPQFVVECRKESNLSEAVSSTEGLCHLVHLRAALIYEQVLQSEDDDVNWPVSFAETVFDAWTCCGITVDDVKDWTPPPSQPCDLTHQGPIDRCILLHGVGTARLWNKDAVSSVQLWCSAMKVALTNHLLSLMQFLGVVFSTAEVVSSLPSEQELLKRSVLSWLALLDVRRALVGKNGEVGNVSFVNSLPRYKHLVANSYHGSVEDAMSHYNDSVTPPARYSPPPDALELLLSNTSTI